MKPDVIWQEVDKRGRLKERPRRLFQRFNPSIVMLYNLRDPSISATFSVHDLKHYIEPFFSDQIKTLNMNYSYKITPAFSRYDKFGGKLAEKDWRYGIFFSSPHRAACDRVSQHEKQWGFGSYCPMIINFPIDEHQDDWVMWTKALLEMLDDAKVVYYIKKIPIREQRQQDGHARLEIFFASQVDSLRARSACEKGLVLQRLTNNEVQLPRFVVR